MGHAFQSPLRRWEVLAGLCQQMSARTLVEVGCKEGRTTGFLLETLPELHVITIDPWAPMANADEDYKDWDFAQIERDFWANVGKNEWRAHMFRMTSMNRLIDDSHQRCRERAQLDKGQRVTGRATGSVV